MQSVTSHYIDEDDMADLVHDGDACSELRDEVLSRLNDLNQTMIRNEEQEREERREHHRQLMALMTKAVEDMKAMIHQKIREQAAGKSPAV